MAETAVVIPISVRDDRATSTLSATTDQVKKLNTEVKKGQDIAKSATQSSSGYASSLKGLASSVAGPAALLAGLYAVIKTGITESMEAEKATKLLAAQYKALGVSNQAVIDDITSYTAALAQKTAQDESDLINLAKLISSFGVYGEALKQATEATLDISAAMGIDQETAARAVGKALQGSTEALKRYGLNVADAATPTERLKNLMVELREKGFSGAASADMDTFSGAVRQLKEGFKDFAETLVNTKLFGLISLRDIFKEITENLAISFKAVSNFVKTGSVSGGPQAMSIAERDAKQQVKAINDVLQKQADKRAMREQEITDAKKREKDLLEKLKERSDEIQKDREEFFKEGTVALDETRSKEEKINDILYERINHATELLKLGEITTAEAQKQMKIYQDTAAFQMKQINDQNAAKAKQDAAQKVKEGFSAVQSGDLGNIASTFGGQDAAGAVGILTVYFKIPQLVKQIGQSISDLFTDWIDGWKDFGDFLDGGLEVFGSRIDALSGSVQNFDERMKALQDNIDDAAMSARSSGENLAVYNQRVADGSKGIKSITGSLDALLDSRSKYESNFLAGRGITGDTVRIHGGSREELNQMFDDLEKQIQEQTVALQNQHQAALQVIAEEYQKKREGQLEQLKLIQDQLNLWEGVQQGFENVKKSIAGSLFSPAQSSAAALEAFKNATGTDKAKAATDLQNALLNEFQAAQQAAASGLITQEELKQKQSSILAQLEMAQKDAMTAEQKLLDKQDQIQSAIQQLNDDEQAAVQAQNAIYLSQLQELKDIKNILAGTQQFQEGGQVNKTGFAFVHEGEHVIPKGGSAGNVNININGKSAGGGSGGDIIAMLQEALKTNRGGIRDTLKRLI